MGHSDSGTKPPLTGLVDMGNTGFYNEPGTLPTFNISDLAGYPGSFGAIVLNVTWAELQPRESGPLDTSPIDNAISAVNAYNREHGTNAGIEIRVWGGYTAPAWAKSIDGPAVSIMGPVPGDPNGTQPETVGRFWSADYIAAWSGFLGQLAAGYDNNPAIVAISNSTGASHTDEPFSVNPSQLPALHQAGYSDAAEELTLRASVADYAGWKATPLEYPMNPFHLDESGTLKGDANFTLAVLQEAENPGRVIQPGNHALTGSPPGADAFIFAQTAVDAALNPATTPASYQTSDPAILGSYADWPQAIAAGITAGAGNIELWDAPGNTGFTGDSPSAIAAMATALANGAAPATGAPDDGKPLQLIAPSAVTGSPGVIPLSGTNAVLLASATGAASYTVSVMSSGGDIVELRENGTLASGSTLTFSGSLASVNTALASLADNVASGTDALIITAADNEGNGVTANIGVRAADPAPSGASAGPMTAGGAGAAGTLSVGGAPAAGGGSTVIAGQASTGALEIAGQPGTTGMLVVAGADTSLAIAGNLDVGGTDSSAGGAATLLAALAPSAYSTASLPVGGTLQVWGEGTVRLTGALGAGYVDIAAGGSISGDGTLATSAGTAILNDGTIEAVADQTLGLQELAVAAPVAGTGEMQIDAGAELALKGAAGAGQTILFAAPSQAQLSLGPYSPTTLALADPSAFAGTIAGFSYAASLLLEGVDASGATYASGTLSVDPAGGGVPLNFALSGDLAGQVPAVSVSGSGSDAATTVTFVPAGGGEAPAFAAPTTLQAAAGIPVAVAGVVLEAPLPAPEAAGTTIAVTITAGTGTLGAGSDNGATSLSRPDPGTLVLTGAVNAVEQSLETLTYEGAAAGADTITLSASDAWGTSAPADIAVTNGSAGAEYAWNSPGGGSFADPKSWTTNGGPAGTAPGGADIAAFGAGFYSVTGEGAAGEISVAGTLTLTGSITAQGLPGTGLALSADHGGAVTLAGGAVLNSAGTAVVGVSGNGLLAVMGGALDVTNAAGDSLVIGENAGSSGTVLDLEQLTAGGTVEVGQSGSGSLELLGVAASASDLSAVVGAAPGGHGAVVINGGEWATAGWLTIGDAGSGSVLIDGAANGVTGQVTAQDATIAHQAGSTGTVSLAGGDLLVASDYETSSTLKVGGGGAGVLDLTDGSNVTVGVALASVGSSTLFNNGTLVVGAAAGGAGSVTIGGGSAVEVDGSTTVGQAGVGQAGVGSVTVGESAADTGLMAMTGSLAIGPAGSVTLGGPGAVVRASAITIAPGGSIEGSGTLSGDGGGDQTVLLSGIVNDGTIAASGGSLLVYGSVAGAGTLAAGTLAAGEGASLTLQAAIGPGQTVLFAQDAVTTLNDVGAFAGTIDGFAAADTIDIGSVPNSGSGTAQMGANNVLTVTEGSQTFHLHFDPTQSFANDIFQLSPDGAWGTALTMTDPPAPAPVQPPPAQPPSIQPVTIEESAAAVEAALNQLEASAQSGGINGIVLTDPGIPTLAVPASVLAADTAVLRFIEGTFNIAVPDSGLQGANAALQSLSPGTSTGAAGITFVDGTMAYSNSGAAAEIDRLYQTVLGRPPDPDGLSQWTSALETGTPLADIASLFLGSPEYQGKFGAGAQNPTGFVTRLYENGLSRAPDPGGLAFWVGQLTSGQMSEAQVAAGISQSSEAISDSRPALASGIWVPNQDAEEVARLYYSALGREPDRGGLEYWTSLLQNGTDSLNQIAGDLLGSCEFLAKYGTLSNVDFVKQMYENALQRAPDPAGGTYWVGELQSGAMSRAGVLVGFSQSQESIALRFSAVEQHGIAYTG